jgi:predicted phosphodiesterase
MIDERKIEKDFIIETKQYIPENRTVARMTNEKFNTDYWDNERVRDVMRKHYKRENKKQFDKIIIPQIEKPQNIKLNNKKIMVTADWHFPYHREDLIENIKKHKEEIVAFVVAGDAFNNDSLSRFPEIGKKTFEEELIDFYYFLVEIRNILPINVKIIMNLGNHECRLYKSIANMQEKGLQQFINPHVISMMVKGFSIYKQNEEIYYPPIQNLIYVPHWFININHELIIAHPEENSKVNVKTAVEAVKYFLEREEKFDAVVIAHTHKYGSTIKNQKWAIQIGASCKPQRYSDKGKFCYTPQDYNYIIFQFDENGKIDRNASKIYMLDEMYPITENVDYNISI